MLLIIYVGNMRTSLPSWMVDLDEDGTTILGILMMVLLVKLALADKCNLSARSFDTEQTQRNTEKHG